MSACIRKGAFYLLFLFNFLHDFYLNVNNINNALMINRVVGCVMLIISPSHICLKCSGLKVVTKIVGLFFAATSINRLMDFALTNKLCIYLQLNVY